MNPIERLQAKIQSSFPSATIRLTKPLRTDGFWSLDIDNATTRIAVEWSVSSGFSISSVDPDTFGEGPDETCSSLDAAEERISHLLVSNERTVPPSAVLLSRLRERCGLTQRELAAKLGISQASLSGIERRSDNQLSTLRRFAHALGGVLEIYCRIEGAVYRLSAEPGESYFCNDRPFRQNSKPIYHFDILQKTGGLPAVEKIKRAVAKSHSLLAVPL